MSSDTASTLHPVTVLALALPKEELDRIKASATPEQDFYCLVAAQVLSCPYRDVTMEQRNAAKSAVFFQVYKYDGHFVSASCEGEFCSVCHKDQKKVQATHKLGEEIAHDDPLQMRHNLTAYVCCTHFKQVLGPATGCP